MSDDITLPPAYRDRDDAEELKERYREMMFEPGEAVGTVASQSISEPATQMTMETYHSAGAAKVSITLGLPRLIEIIDTRKNPKTPIMDVYLEDGYRDEESARDVAAEIQAVTFQDVVSTDSFDIAHLELEFEVDESVLDEFRIDMDEVVDVLREKLNNAHLEHSDGTITAYPDAEDYDLTDLQEMKKKAMDVRLKGIKGIEHVVLVEDEEDDEYRIQTAGVNLRKVLKLEGVDQTRTTTNDLFEAEKVLGLEAARNLILEELQSTLDEQGMNVDVRWLLMISDTMTKNGEIQGCTRYGLTGAKHSVLARSAFEETKKHLTTAALKGEEDPLDSVVENLMVGQVIPVGTGQLELKAEPGKADPVEDPTVPMEVETPDTTDYEELVDGTVDEVKDRVREEDVDVTEVLAAERAGKDRSTLTNWLEGRTDEDTTDYASLVDGTVDEVKDAVRDDDLDPDKVLAAEQDGKDRKTLVEWLERRAEEA